MSETDVLEAAAVTDEARTQRRRRGVLPERCFACDAPVLGPYCYACGQKNDDCRRSLIRLGAETVQDVASLDSRFVRTLRAVVTRPGRHVREYGAGRRSPYSPPIRFFLVVTFLFFTTLVVTDRQIVVLQPEVAFDDAGQLQLGEMTAGFFVKPKDVHYTEAERAAMRSAVSEGRASHAVTLESIRAEADADMAAIQEETEAQVEALRAAGGEDVLAEIREARAEAQAAIAEIRSAAAEDIRSFEEIAEQAERSANAGGTITLNGREVEAERLVDAAFRAAENPRAFNNALDDWIPRIMILMIPLLALLGAVFVRGKDALLYDHALLSLNTHAMAFGIMTLGLWTSAFLPGWLFAIGVFVGVPVYYAKALRGAFGRSRRKVIVATLFVFTVYGFVLSAALTTAAVSAFADTI